MTSLDDIWREVEESVMSRGLTERKLLFFARHLRDETAGPERLLELAAAFETREAEIEASHLRLAEDLRRALEARFGALTDEERAEQWQRERYGWLDPEIDAERVRSVLAAEAAAEGFFGESIIARAHSLKERVQLAAAMKRVVDPLPPPVRNPELLAVLRAHPEDESLLRVYADWLEEQGSPHGELIHLQLDDRRLEARIHRLRNRALDGALAYPGRVQTDWHAGFVRSLVIGRPIHVEDDTPTDALLSACLKNPVCDLLAVLMLRELEIQHQKPLTAALEDKPLKVIGFDGPGLPLGIVDLTPIGPTLEELLLCAESWWMAPAPMRQLEHVSIVSDDHGHWAEFIRWLEANAPALGRITIDSREPDRFEALLLETSLPERGVTVHRTEECA